MEKLYNIFPHYLINGTIFKKRKGIAREIFVLISLQRLCGTILILRRSERDMIKNVYYYYKAPVHIKEIVGVKGKQDIMDIIEKKRLQ